jgi:FlaA1/EpsC-like NDP-sugar epimerase
LMLFFAALIAYDIRYRTQIERLFPEGYQINFKDFLFALTVMIPVFIIVFALAGLYNTKVRRTGIDEIGKIFLAISSGFMGIIVLIFFKKELFLSSRFIVLGSWVATIITVSVGRLITRQFQKFLYKYDIGVHRSVIIGHTAVADDITKEASKRPHGVVAVFMPQISHKRSGHLMCRSAIMIARNGCFVKNRIK